MINLSQWYADGVYHVSHNGIHKTFTAFVDAKGYIDALYGISHQSAAIAA